MVADELARLKKLPEGSYVLGDTGGRGATPRGWFRGCDPIEAFALGESGPDAGERRARSYGVELDRLEQRYRGVVSYVLRKTEADLVARVRDGRINARNFSDLRREMAGPNLKYRGELKSVIRRVLRKASAFGAGAVKGELQRQRAAPAPIAAAYDEAQHPRADDGEWTSGAPGRTGDEFFHGTSAKFAKKILKDGLRAHDPKSGKNKSAVFVARDLAMAQFFAERGGGGRAGAGQLILKIVVPKDHTRKFETDRNNFEFVKGKPASMAYQGDIPPEWIKGAWLQRRGANAWEFKKIAGAAVDGFEFYVIVGVPEDSVDVVALDFDESKHPRVPAGSPGGGEFGPGEGGNVAELMNASKIPRMTPKERKVLGFYGHSGWEHINRSLRDTRVQGDPNYYPMQKSIKEAVATMDSVFDKYGVPLPKSLILYRGVVAGSRLLNKGLTDPYVVESNQALVERFKGKTLSDRGYQSTSLTREAATNFIGLYTTPGGVAQVILHIEVPPGTKVIPMSDWGFSKRKSELEILLPRNGELKVGKVSLNKNNNLIDIWARWVKL